MVYGFVVEIECFKVFQVTDMLAEECLAAFADAKAVDQLSAGSQNAINIEVQPDRRWNIASRPPDEPFFIIYNHKYRIVGPVENLPVIA
jgi:hypothetical protein